MDEPQPVGEEAVAVVLPPGASLVPTHNSPPSKPPRSPLRPRPAPVLVLDDTPTIAMALASLSSLAAPLQADKPLPLLHDEEETSSSGITATAAATPTLTKRQHALHELLSSERAYASDLALVREVHIPLALGQSIPHSLPAVSPPNNSSSGSGSGSGSGSSSRTVSIASDPSTSAVDATANGLAAGAATGPSADFGPSPPMTPDDVKFIFGNITEIAVFSDLFCQPLEEALGDLLEGGKGDDHVGALFLSIIPELERPYKQYITRHPTALNHLQSLPQTPALQNYLSYTQAIASSLSHAWDLSSLLIKPVQRLLKYPLLLTAIIEETPDSHPDKESLKEARKQMEEVARNVNEGRRRAEVVRDVLMAKKKSQTPGMTVSASVNLNKVKSLRVAGSTSNSVTTGGKNDKDDKTPEEAILVAHLESELHAIELFAQQFAKNIVEWARMTSNVILSLRTWSLSFSKVIGLTSTSGSEAFDAYLIVVEKQLMPLCVDLEAVINERVLKELAHLLMTMTQPLKLLESMNEQEPYHHHLMNMPVSQKNRPPPSLLSASTNYLALRGQLAAELPTYISLLHRGLRIFIYRLAAIQTEFWGKVRDQWAGLWEMLRLEEELNAGGEETVNVWFGRWGEVNEVLMSLSIVRDPKVVYAELKARARVFNANNAAVTISEYRKGDRSRPERDREYHGDRELADPGADAEYYTLHHLQTFAHHREATPPPANIYPLPHPSPSTVSYSPSDIGNGYGGYVLPNSPNSYSTSYSGGGGDHRRDSHQSSSSHYHPHHSHHPHRTHSRDHATTRDRDRERYEREKKKSSAQASNALTFLGALEPPLSPKFKQKSESPTAATNHRNSGVSGVSGHSGGSGSSSNSTTAAARGGGGGKTRRGSTDLSSNAGAGGTSSWMSAVGLGGTFGAGGGIVGGIATSSSGSNGGGGGGEKRKNKTVVEKKTSDESFVSKTTVRSPVSSSPQQQQRPQYTQYHSYQQPHSPNSPNRTPSSSNNNASTSTGHSGTARQPAPYPQPHRRRTIEPTPDDLRDYGAMLMKEEERRKERGVSGYRGNHQQQYPQPQSQQQQQAKRPSVGSRSVSATNPYTNSTNTHDNELPQHSHTPPHHHNHGGLPRTKSMPLPHYPLTTHPRPSSSRGNANFSFSTEEEHTKRGAGPGVGEWSTMVVVASDDYRDHGHDLDVVDDEEDSELFYRPQVSIGYGQGQGYEEGEEGYEYHHNGRNGNGRSARPRERRDATTTSSPVVARETKRLSGEKSHSRSRQRSVGKEGDVNGKRHSEHSAYSSKSDKRPGDVKNDKGEKAGEKEKEKEKERDKDKDKDKEKTSRKRSGSIKSITSFFSPNRDSHHSDTILGSGIGTPPLSHSSSTFTTSTAARTTTDHTPSPRDSWALKPAKYTCIVTHPCKPPSTSSGTNNAPLSYFSFPFFTLKEGELYDVLQEAGHPSLHPNLPLIVDEGEDCLLLCRRSARGGSSVGTEGESSVGWALASFLEPCNSNVKEL